MEGEKRMEKEEMTEKKNTSAPLVKSDNKSRREVAERSEGWRDREKRWTQRCPAGLSQVSSAECHERRDSKRKRGE